MVAFKMLSIGNRPDREISYIFPLACYRRGCKILVSPMQAMTPLGWTYGSLTIWQR